MIDTMMIQRFLLFALFFLPVLSAQGVADAQVQAPIDVAQLLRLCDSTYDVDVGMCAGYVTAVAESIMNNSRPEQRVCLNPAIGPETLIENVRVSWAKDAPMPTDGAFGAVEGALRRRFRCS